MRRRRHLGRLAILFLIGGAVYVAIEVLWRGTSHRSMFVVGGLCFVLLGLLNEWMSWDTPLLTQSLIGAGIVTAIEFAGGCVLNRWLGLGVWDYSTQPLNLLGQICAPYAALWVPLSAVGIVLDDLFRWRLFGERKPKYTIFLRRRSI